MILMGCVGPPAWRTHESQDYTRVFDQISIKKNAHSFGLDQTALEDLDPLDFTAAPEELQCREWVMHRKSMISIPTRGRWVLLS